MWGRTVHFLLQPGQSPDLDTLDIGEWWYLEANLNELNWSSRNNRPHELLADLNDTVLQSLKSCETSEMLKKQQRTLYQNYRAVFARNDYDRRFAPSNPTVALLREHFQKARVDPMWFEARKMQYKFNQ